MSGIPRRVPCVGAIVHDNEHRLLMIRRGTPPGVGRWSLPGGRVEEAEDDVEAVRREVTEETGLMVVVGVRVGTVVLPGPGGVNYDVRDYACSVLAGVLRAGDDATDARWVSRAELADLDTAPGLVETLTTWGMLPR